MEVLVLVVVVVVVVVTSVGCMSDVLLGVKAEVTEESVEMFVIGAGTVGVIVTPVSSWLT